MKTVSSSEGRKGQIFLLDLILSIVIVVVTAGLYLSYYSSSTSNSDIYDLNLEITNRLTMTNINALNSREVVDLFLNNEIRNIQNTVAQQIGEYYYLGNVTKARFLSEVFLEDYVTNNYNMNVTLIDGSTETVLYTKINKNITLEDSEISSRSERIVFGFINKSTSYGPYTYRVIMWQ